jgi:CBS domain-containing protein
VRGRAFDGPADASAEDVMEPGPTTIRLDESLTDVARRLRDQHVDSILVTTPDGRLVGVLMRADAEDELAKHGEEESAGG